MQKIPLKITIKLQSTRKFWMAKIEPYFHKFFFFFQTFFPFCTSAYFWSLSLSLLIHGFYYYLTNYTKLNYQFNIIKWTLCTKLFFSKNESLNHEFTMLVCCL